MNLSDFIKRHPVLTYFALTYAISFGGLLVAVGGPSGVSATNTAVPFMTLYVTSVIGPLTAGILLTSLIYGKAGLRELGARLLKWRVGIQWWAAALLIGPLSMLVALFALSFTPLAVVTGFATATDKTAFAVFCLAGGLMNGVVEEIGWTGFAVPRMVSRSGVFATGLSVGIGWGFWHLPPSSLGTAAAADTVPLVLYIGALCFTFLPPLRILMTWVYEHTQSVLVGMLMHATTDSALLFTGYTMANAGVGPSAVIGVTRATWFLLWGIMLWIVVAAVAVAKWRRPRFEPIRSAKKEVQPMQPTALSFIRRHPVLSYYILVFAISWGGGLLAFGPSGFMGISVTPRTQLLIGVPIGILGPAIAGPLMTGLLYGRPGLRELTSRLLRWRVGAGWYAFALLAAPIITTLSLLARSTPPAIATASDKLGLLLISLAIGLGSSPFFEELGWTGFAIPELRKRFGILATGLLMGVLWGVWHFPVFSATGRASEPLSPLVFTLALLFTWLIPYRVLMVWVYDRTHSLLVAILMHMPIAADPFLLSPAAASTTFTATSNLIFAIVLWILVIVIFMVSRRRLGAPVGSTGRATP